MRFAALKINCPEHARPAVRRLFGDLEKTGQGHPVVEGIDRSHMDLVIAAPDLWRSEQSQKILLEVRTKGGIMVTRREETWTPETSAQTLFNIAKGMVGGIFSPDPAEGICAEPKTVVLGSPTISAVLRNAILGGLGLKSPPAPGPANLLEE